MKKLGFGTMRLPLKNNSIDMEIYKKMIDEFISNGFTYFDTAWMYCNDKSEEALNEALVKRYPRDAYTVTTKLPSYEIQSLQDRDRVFNEQKRRTGLDYFDWYFIHAISAKSLDTFNKFDCWEYLKHKKEIGEIKHIGFSYHDGPELLDEILTKHPEVECVQLQLNYLDWLSKDVQSKGCYDVCVKHNKPVMVMEPVKGGKLVGIPDEAKKLFKEANPNLSIASWAIRFAASLKNVYVVLSGMSNMEQLEDNISYMKDFIPLTDKENNTCLEVAEIIKKIEAIPCTGCDYCKSTCPIGMPISKLFSLYNIDKEEKGKTSWISQESNYKDIQTKEVKIDECIDCGACENICPQHLSIRKYLKQVKEYFENNE